MEYPIEEPDQEYKRGGALQVKKLFSRFVKMNENIMCDNKMKNEWSNVWEVARILSASSKADKILEKWFIL